MCSARQYGSTDMKHDLFRLGHEFGLDPGLGQIFNLTFQGQIIVHSTRLDKRNTMLAKLIA